MSKAFDLILELVKRKDVKISDHGYEEKIMRKRKHTKFIHEGEYVAEVDIELIDTDEGWSPYLSLEDAQKLDDVREALRRGDVKSACRFARVFNLTPVAV